MKRFGHYLFPTILRPVLGVMIVEEVQAHGFAFRAGQIDVKCERWQFRSPVLCESRAARRKKLAPTVMICFNKPAVKVRIVSDCHKCSAASKGRRLRYLSTPIFNKRVLNESDIADTTHS